MSFMWKIWKFSLTLKIIDVDPTDKKIGVGIYLSW
jgi:hypothetical protein